MNRRIHIMNDLSPAQDTILQWLLVLGPGALSLAIAAIARRLVRNVLLQVLCGALAFLLIVAQVFCLAAAMMMVAGYGGNPLRSPFTLGGLVGLVIYLGGLVICFRRPIGQGNGGRGAKD